MSTEPEPYEPGRLESILLRIGTVGELLAMMMRGGRWWMLPATITLLGIAGVLLVLQGIQYVAPFVYMVF
ncbi:MAG: hypothetical protein FJ090_10250 [Deltaproteobacteria bacterium]|nr:hypothetical protein [Deltaproteobacteria bacterium]